MSDALKIFSDLWGQLGKLPVAIVISLVAMALGLVLKKASFVGNKWIPLFVLVWCAFWYTLLGDAAQINPAQKYPRVILCFYGILLGFVTWSAHKFLLKKAEKFLPDGFFPEGSFDTDEFTKDPSKPTQPTDQNKT